MVETRADMDNSVVAENHYTIVHNTLAEVTTARASTIDRAVTTLLVRARAMMSACLESHASHRTPTRWYASSTCGAPTRIASLHISHPPPPLESRLTSTTTAASVLPARAANVLRDILHRRP